MSERFETGRLILRVSEETDESSILDFYLRNRKFFEPWDPKFADDFFTIDFHKRKIKLEKEIREKGIEYRYYVFNKIQPQRVIGIVAISNIVRGVLQSAFLGYSVDENENRKGIATEAIKRVIEASFNEINLHRLEANVIPTNAASIRVLEKLNFVKEGYSKKYLKINNKWEDHLRFAIINPDFTDD